MHTTLDTLVSTLLLQGKHVKFTIKTTEIGKATGDRISLNHTAFILSSALKLPYNTLYIYFTIQIRMNRNSGTTLN